MKRGHMVGSYKGGDGSYTRRNCDDHTTGLSAAYMHRNGNFMLHGY